MTRVLLRVTMATAIVSLLTGIPVRCDVAMTGEITLRGRVLPVGGVREKALAALRRGISRVILPEANRHDLEEIPPELARKMSFEFVRDMNDVLRIVLAEPLVPAGRIGRSARPLRPAVSTG